MTCIAGLVSGGSVYLGADSAGIAGWSLTVRADKKIFRNGPFLMGFTSSFRMGQILAFNFVPPTPRQNIDPFVYMATEFVDGARQAMKVGGFARLKENADQGGDFLVGFAGRLFHIAEDFQVGEALSGFDACGCGQDVALGSLYSTREWREPPGRVREALAAAEALNAGVRGPFILDALKGDGS